MKRSFFSKLLVMNAAVVAAAVLVVALLLPQLISGYIFNQKERELTAKGTALARLTEGYYAGTVSEESFLEMLASLDQFLEARIWVVNRQGIVIKASYGERPFRRGPMIRLAEGPAAQLARGETVVTRHHRPHFDEVMLSVGVPIIIRGDPAPAGAIFLHAPVTAIAVTVSNLLQFTLISGLIAVSLALLLGYAITRRLSHPLREAAEAARSMGRGEFTCRIKIRSEDELGELADSLNYLAGRLEHTITALQREKSKFKSMVTGMQEGVVGVNSAGELTYINSSVRRMLRLDEAALNLRLEQAFPSPGFAAPFLGALAGGKPETAVVELEGNHYSVRVSPVEDEADGSTGAVGLIQDISESERLELMRREFIANVSHELRTPITVLKGFTGALLDGTAEAAQKTRYLHIIRTEIDHLNRLISDLLDLSRLQAGRLELFREAFDLKKQAVELKARLEPQLAAKKLHLSISMPPGLRVWGDRDRILQVLLNLVENAIRYSPEGEKITLRGKALPVSSSAERAEIMVEDNGPGIPADMLPHIWERFYRGDKSRDRKQGGTGLGLAIAREIIEAHGETISADSTPGKGSTFRFTLPAAKGR